MSSISSASITSPFDTDDTASKIIADSAQTLVWSDCFDCTGNYTLNFWIKAESDCTVQIRIKDISKNISVTTDWQRVILSFSLADISDNAIYYELPIGTYYFFNSKLEKGNRYTDYTVSDTDIAVEIQSASDLAKSKSRNIYSASEPEGTFNIGDTWFNTAKGYAISKWNGTAWELSQLGADAIAELSIVNANIANGTIQAAKIGTVDAGSITTGTLDANRIGAGSIGIGAFTTELQQTLDFTTESVSQWCYDNDSTYINGGKIYTDTILSDAINSNQILARHIKGGEVKTDQLDANAVTAGKIATGSIVARHITANAVNADKLAVTDFTNYITTTELTEESAIEKTDEMSCGNKIAGGYITKYDTSDSAIYLSNFNPNFFVKDDSLRFQLAIHADVSSKIRLEIVFTDSAGELNVVTRALSEEFTVPRNDITIEGTIKIPDLGRATFYYVAVRDYTNSGNIYAKNATLKMQAGTVYIANGAVTADKIVSHSITADQIFGKTITANEIAGNTITADLMSVNTLSAITADLGTVTAGTIKSSNYVANTSGLYIDLSAGTWDSKYTKFDQYGNATLSGGTIGGAGFNDSFMWANTGDDTTGLGLIWSDHEVFQGVAMWVGKPNYQFGDSPFLVYHDGTVKASKLNVAGGSIGSWIVNGDGLYSKNLWTDGYLRTTFMQSAKDEGSWVYSIQKGTTPGDKPAYNSSVFCVYGNGNIDTIGSIAANGNLGIGGSITANGILTANGALKTTVAQFGNGSTYTIYAGGGSNDSFIECNVNDKVVSGIKMGYNSVSIPYFNSTSDLKVKDVVKEMDDDAVKLIMSLIPIEYKRTDLNDTMLRLGFGAQDIYKSASAIWDDNMRLYQAFDKSDHPLTKDQINNMDDRDIDWKMSYEELIAPLVKTVQYLFKKVEVLENKLY